MSDARTPREDVQFDNFTALGDEFRSRLKDTLSTDLDSDQSDYFCDGCQERCLNPPESPLAESGLCLDCHVHYSLHGHIRARIAGRWS